MSGRPLSEKLLLTPLFQGLSKNDLHEIVGKAHFDFFKVEEGRWVVKHDAYSSKLIVMLTGEMELQTTTADHMLTTTEVVHAPAMIEADRLFGMHQRYLSDYKAKEECSFLSITKEEVVELLNNYDIIRINMINMLANNLQRYHLLRWQEQKTELEGRLMQLLLSHTRIIGGEKQFKVKMSTLAKWLGCSRLAVSKALKKLQEEGKVLLSRNLIQLGIND